ncbi:MAG: AAA family ATPase [Candidatus Hydrogenedentes bacterium]|nr:AAA family ATPase [Candidatus Hydrogenedentota bacterium]
MSPTTGEVDGTAHALDAVSRFQDAVEAAGLGRPEIVGDGKLHRFKAPGDHAANSWYCLHSGGIAAGAFGCWKRGISETWSSNNGHEMSPEERRQLRDRMEQIKKQRQAEEEQRAAEAKREADQIWNEAKAVEKHAYLERKKVASHGLRVTEDGRLIVPLCDAIGEIHSLQFISANGAKRFLTGGRIAGRYFLIGTPDNTICIAEGFATAASIHEATDYAAVVAFDAGNLEPVAREIRRQHPNAKIIVCADDDAWTDGNPGVTKGTEAARAVGARLTIPKFADRTSKPTDFDDLLILEGAEKVRGQINSAEAASSKRGVGLQLTRLGDLLREPEPDTEFLVDQMLPSGGSSILVAKPKVGKSTFARQLALDIARGSPFLNRKTMPGPVIYLALEEKRSEVRKHFAAMGASGDEDIFIHCATAPENALTQVREIAIEKKAVVIVIDTLFKLVRVRDGNDYASVTTALEPIHTLARETGTHVVVVHHLGKGDRPGGDGVLGSTAILAAFDTAILLRRDGPYRTIETIQRYGDNIPETILNFDPHRRTTSLGESKEVDERKRFKAAIKNYLTGQSEAVTEADIKDEVQGRNKMKSLALRELVRDGMVNRIGKGGKTDPFRYGVTASQIDVPGIAREPGNKNPQGTTTTESVGCCFVVPDSENGAGNQNKKTDLRPLPASTYSGSHVSGTSTAFSRSPGTSKMAASPSPETDLLQADDTDVAEVFL